MAAVRDAKWTSHCAQCLRKPAACQDLAPLCQSCHLSDDGKNSELSDASTAWACRGILVFRGASAGALTKQAIRDVRQHPLVDAIRPDRRRQLRLFWMDGHRAAFWRTIDDPQLRPVLRMWSLPDLRSVP